MKSIYLLILIIFKLVLNKDAYVLDDLRWDKSIDGWMDKYLEQVVCGWVDGRKKGWMDRWTGK